MNPRAVIRTTIADSTPAFAPLPRPPAGAPNVVVIVLDDLGFGQLGCFGSDIATPNIDGLAASGLRYNRFHVTALCSPTRACLLTGRNHHAVGMGFLTDIPIGFPAYNGRIPPSAATLPRILRDAGYSTFAVGKWHLAPRWEQSASGPFDRWPLGLGFERYYGFLGGDTNQWTPELVSDNGFVEPPARPEDGYHLTEDLADRATRLVQDQRQATPGKPFFLYFATGAMHAPHHVGPDWISPYEGRFDGGWERWREQVFARQQEMGVVPSGTRLTPRPPWVQDWDALSDGERRLFARMMEVFAGFLTHTDAQIGRLMDRLAALGVLDDTLVLLISDNGTSAEGGPLGSFNEHRFTHDLQDELETTLTRADELGGFRAYNHYPWGWAWAGNTPLRLWKRFSWLGGVRTPLVVRWPERLAGEGGIRSQFCHAIDLMPTVLDAAGIEPPVDVAGVGQQPIEGASLLATFGDPAAPEPRATQYFEIVGSRAIYHDGWKATTDHVGNQLAVERALVEGSHDFATDRWALFNLSEDFSEAVDLAEEEPERLRALQDLWWAEAGRNQVLPLDDSFLGRVIAMEPAPNPPRHLTTYLPGGNGIAEDMLPAIGSGFRLHAALEVTDERASGIVCALGDWTNGWAFYLLDGCPVAAFNLFGDGHRVAAPEPLSTGRHELLLEYDRRPGGGGGLRLAVDGTDVATGTLPRDLPFRWQIGGAGLLVGRDRGFPVCDDYEPPFEFQGTIERITFEVPLFAPPEPAEEVAVALKHE